MSDTDTFKRSLREAWQDISKPQTQEVYDDLIEHFLLLFSHQARGGRRTLQALLSQGVINIPSHKSHRLIFRQLAVGIVAWYESDFEKASKVFGELAIRLGTYRSPPGGLDPFVTFSLRLHVLIWTAASECRLGHCDKSQEILDEVRLDLKSRKDFRCPNCLGWYHAERGRTCFWSDDTARANYHYTRSIDIFRQTKNRFGLAEAANACARLCTHEGRYADALDHLTTALGICHEDPLELAKSLFHKGRILRFQLRFIEAVEPLTEALKLAEQVGNWRWEANIHDALGDVYLELKEIKKAKDHFGAKLRVSDSIITLRSEYQNAKLKCVEALQLPENRQSRQRALLQVIDDCRILREKAETQMIREKTAVIEAIAAWHLKDYLDAIKAFGEATAGFKEHHAHWYLAETHLLFGNLERDRGNIADAAKQWLAGLQATKDEGQRERIMKSIDKSLDSFDPHLLCECLTEMKSENDRLRESNFASQELFRRHIELIQSIAFGWDTWSCLTHLNRIAMELSDLSEDIPECRKHANESRAIYQRLEPIIMSLYRLDECLESFSGQPEIISVEHFLETANKIIPIKKKGHAKRNVQGLGILIEPSMITCLMTNTLTAIKSLGSDATVLWLLKDKNATLEIQFHISRLSINMKLLSELFSGKSLAKVTQQQTKITPKIWAGLAVVVVLLRSFGGDIVTEQVKTSSQKKSGRSDYILSMRLPYIPS